MLQSPADTSLEDIAFLARSEHRVSALVALADRPRSRSQLRDVTGASSSTVSRLVRQFEQRHWVVRNGHQYEATELGAFVASGMRDLLERIDTEHKLRDVWERLPNEADGFTIDMASDAVVTVADADGPYQPINRFTSLLGETDRFRFVGSDLALLEPCRDEFRNRVLEGMDAEIVDPPSVARYVRSQYPDHCTGPLESGNLTILVHDDLPPYGVCLFDDRIGISCYNPINGTVQAFVDTDAPEAREWAESIYASYRRDARQLAADSSE
ncbi:helix-turn-helix transcriptional regulator [Natronobacterium texcoconense]|uniref:Predicted transcriptional regulator, contains HTH domain n=1 Tax=Natronobacterium texcoconense TaxID=1095778 RepID=A0A1H0Z9E7_NATTX|nr:MarR family transcriptional regulator [Natronobacterium texcoconense]SDQ24033.1 Predicted transcriptional regulator, contains HTH domain [Natronobacterium texcoconense]